MRAVTSKKWLISGLVIIILGILGFWFYQTFLHWSGSFKPAADFDELLQDWSGLNNIPGLLLHIEQGQEVIYSNASGYQSHDAQIEINSETPFHTASVGKIFTSITLLRLHEQGIVSLDEPIGPYVDPVVVDGLLVIDGVDYVSDITFRHLATHQSGLPNLDESLRFQYWILSQPERKRSPEEMIQFSKKMPPVGRPGETAAYSSTGYWLLGLALEGATGKAYHEIVREELLDPLKMTQTFESNLELDPNLEMTHHYFGPINLATTVDPSFEFADGGFVTTSADLVKLSRALVDQTLFETDEATQLFSGFRSDTTELGFEHGFGFFWAETADGNPYLFQPGFWGVRFVVFPEEELTIVFTLNQSNTLAQKFLDQTIDLLEQGGYISK